MEDSQVLDAKPAPLQAPEAIQEDSPVLTPQNETPNKSIYSGGSPVVGEVNHASDISNNITRDMNDSKPAVDQSRSPEIQTISTTKGNVTDRATWNSHYGMDDTYKAQDNSDYSWNELAQHRSQYTYDQEANQVLSDYAKSMAEIKEAGSRAMDTYFGAAYSANQTADKMGWQGGQVQSNDAKTAFLKASTAAGMYDKFELQKYGVDSQLSVARMYAEANMEALALDLYQDSINQAVREAEITGWYIAPEASEIMKQQKVANEILDNKNSSREDIARANKVINAGNAYFDKLGFQKDEHGHYIGIETLNSLEFKETQATNRENERLQGQANEIADRAVTATENLGYAQLRLAEKDFKYTKNMTERQNWIEANKTYGVDKTGVGNFIKDSKGNYVAATNVYTANDGKTYANVNGKTYVVKANDGGYYTKVSEASSSVDTIKKQDEEANKKSSNPITNWFTNLFK